MPAGGSVGYPPIAAPEPWALWWSAGWVAIMSSSVKVGTGRRYIERLFDCLVLLASRQEARVCAQDTEKELLCVEADEEQESFSRG